MEEPPLRISLVTPSRNAAARITAAIESARASTDGLEVEHIIADAASDDGTLDILARWPHLVVDSRPDRGIYDGLNRALALATGDVIGFLNADDTLEPGALGEVAAMFAARPSLDLVTGGARVVDDVGARGEIVYVPSRPPHAAGLLFGVPLLNARFLSRRFIDRVGPFDLSLPAASDRAWLLRAVTASPRSAWTARPLYRYVAHAGSRTLAGTTETGPRLWREHVRLADSLSCDPSTAPELAAIARQWRAVEQAKLALGGEAGGHGGRLRQLLARGPTWDLALGLRLWRRHRGRHADA